MRYADGFPSRILFFVPPNDDMLHAHIATTTTPRAGTAPATATPTVVRYSLAAASADTTDIVGEGRGSVEIGWCRNSTTWTVRRYGRHRLSIIFVYSFFFTETLLR